MYHNDLEEMLTKAVDHANTLVADRLVTLDDVQAIFTDATKRIEVNVKSKSFVFGNAYTGDVGALIALCDSDEPIDTNWVKAVSGKFKICAKVFATQSSYGINGGRISKLQICDTSQEHWGWEKTYLNYDRGWDIIPDVGEEVIDFLNKILVALGDEALSDDDYIHIRKVWGENNSED